MSRKNELKSLLIRNLPSKIAAGNQKHTVNYKQNRNKPTVLALKRNRFITFNTEERISMMVFDIDKVDGENTVDMYTLEEFVHHIYAEIGLVPTYTCQTDRGFHFAFHLKYHVKKENEKAWDYLIDIKKAVTKSLGLDQMASHRLRGVWRNPLRHPTWYSGQIGFELKDFNSVLINNRLSRSYTKRSKGAWPIIPVSQLTEGQRHSKLFLIAINFAAGTTSLSFDLLKNFLDDLNIL